MLMPHTKGEGETMNITPATIKELVSEGFLTDTEDNEVCFGIVANETSHGHWQETHGMLGYEKAANIFNAVLAAKIRKELAPVPASDLPMPEGFPEMSQKDFSVQMRLVALEALIRGKTNTFESRLHRLEVSKAFPTPAIRSKYEELEARIRELELRSTSDD